MSSYYWQDEDLYNKWVKYLDSVKDSTFTMTNGTTKYTYTKNELIDVVVFKMSGHGSLSQTPEAMETIISGNHQEVSGIIDYYLQPSGQALGMRFSCWIAEELSEESPDRVQAAGTSIYG